MATTDKERGAVRCEAKSFAVVSNRTRDIPQRQLGSAPAGKARRVVGPKLDGLAEVGNSVGRRTGVGTRIAAIAVGCRLVVGAVSGA